MPETQLTRWRIWRCELLLSMAFLTRLPIVTGQDDERPLMRVAWCFPFVGLIIGAVAAAVAVIARVFGIPDLAAGLAAITTAILLTGALHEDGLADTCDGFGGGRDRDSKITIMRDSRIGTFGALALVLVIFLKAAALGALLGQAALYPVVAGMIVAHVTARAAMVGAVAGLPPASESGLGYRAGRPSVAVTIVALASATGLVFVMLPLAAGVAVVCGAGVAGFVVSILALWQIGGYTGDVLGATEQVVETIVLLTVAAVYAPSPY